MRTIEIPEPLYEEAASRAAASGKSVEALVLDVLIEYLDDAPLVLTPEQLAIIDQAEADIDAGRFYTAEEVEAQLDATRDAWIREHTH